MSEPAASLSPIPLMQIATGFWASKTLAAANELNLFTRLSGTAGTTIEELAVALAVHPRPAEMLLTGCAALGLLEKQNDRYRNSPLAEQFLVKGQPYYFGGFIEMLDKRLYPGWGKLTEAIRTNRPTTWDPDKQKSLFEGEDPAMMALFWEAMHSASTFTARALAGAVDFRPFKRLLDVGGGSGAYDIELCRYYPHLHATVYDLPFVTEIAAEKIAQAQLSGRIDTAAGDFFADPTFPADHDAVLLSMILHDWDEAKDREILRKCYAALPSGGVVIISELLADDNKTGPVPAALMSLNMLIETEGGRNYTAGEYSAWLDEVGFGDIQTVRFEAAGANGVVLARKP
jgi:3-hydroxy-5-methyl-1-naphthoate 3-O-methyltransferase